MLNQADLPNDIDALKALLLAPERTVRERDAAIAARDEQVSGLRAQLTTTEVEIEHLKLMIAKLRRLQFGRKFGKLDHQIDQLECRHLRRAGRRHPDPGAGAGQRKDQDGAAVDLRA